MVSKKTAFRCCVAYIAFGFAELAAAQTAPQRFSEAGDDPTAIIVTARRAAENLQDVPASVQAISGADIQRLSLTRVTDISRVAPGLTLSTQGTTGGAEPTIVLRGVRWTDASGTPAIPIYLNEISFLPGVTLGAMFDIGQIEVLRGPQGTTRGAPSISGAITLSTRRPDLEAVGGYVSGLIGNLDHRNLQAAINVPVIHEKLAVRVAGFYEESDGNSVHSLINSADPYVKSWGGRISVLAKPIEDIEINAMFQKTNSKYFQYSQLAGPGSAGFTGIDPSAGFVVAPPNFNGPAIAPGQRLSLAELGNRSDSAPVTTITVNTVWEVLGHQLFYNFGYQQTHPGSGALNGQDNANILLGFDYAQSVKTAGSGKYYTHEIRFSSIKGLNDFIDYDAGVYFYKSGNPAGLNIDSIASFISGAFGNPFAGALSPAVDPAAALRYNIPISILAKIQERNFSAFGSVQLHLPSNIELTAGLRYIQDKRPTQVKGATGAGFALAAANPAPGVLTCEGLGAGLVTSPIYSGYCDFPLPAGLTSFDQSYNKKFNPVIYNISLSKKLSDDVMIYATVGSSYRTGVLNIATFVDDPDLLFSKPEKATSYEIGIKSAFFNKVRLNAAIFQIDYKDQLIQSPGIKYFNVATANEDTTSRAFFSNTDARVRGAEFEVAFDPTPEISLGANLSYAKLESKGGVLPCNNPAIPLNASNIINRCAQPSGRALNASPAFQASLNGSYTKPIGPFEGYFRFIINHQGSNPNFGFEKIAQTGGVSSSAKVGGFTLVDLFAGLAGNDGDWDIGVFAKNVFNKKVELASLPGQGPGGSAIFTPGPLGTGYDGIAMTAPRELGLTLRYSFGSR